MQLKISLLAKIKNKNTTTFYFIHKKSNIVLPIDLHIRHSNFDADTYVRTLNTLETTINSIKIYLHLENTYYVYLAIKKDRNIYDINTSLENALCIINYKTDLEIYVEKEVLEQEGIKITKDMLELSYLDI